MIYGDEKRREMVRSILPSKKREGASWRKKTIKQHSRRSIRQELHKTLGNIDYTPEDDVDLHAYPDHEIRSVVRDRRDADKLAHFEKWATHITRHLPEAGAKLAHMKAILPAGLIGDHALGHLRFLEGFELQTFRRYFFDEEAYRVKRQQKEAADQALLRKALTEMIISGWGHRLLNQSLEHQMVYWSVWTKNVPTTEVVNGVKMSIHKDKNISTPVGPTRARKLLGLGDIEAFLSDLRQAQSRSMITVPPFEDHSLYAPRGGGWNTVRPNPNHHPEWADSLWAFVRRWESCKGDRKALLSK